MASNHIPQLIRGVLLGGLLLLTISGSFAGVSYDVTQVNANRWEYQYQVFNDTTQPLSEFSIFFDRTLFGNLAVEASSADWGSIILQPDNSLPSDGLFDALALGPALGMGEGIGGFRVSFDFLGQGAPGSQHYSFLDAEFNEISTGATIASGAQTVPEPSSLLLAISGLALAGSRLRKKLGSDKGLMGSHFNAN